MKTKKLDTASALDIYSKLVGECLGIQHPPFNSYELARDAAAIRLEEGEAIGPWHGGETDHLWLIKEGSMRSVLEFKAGTGRYYGIDIHECGNIVGFWEGISTSCNVTYLCSSKHAILIGVPIAAVLMAAGNNSTEKIRPSQKVVSLPYIAYVASIYLDHHYGLLKLKESIARSLLSKMLGSTIDLTKELSWQGNAALIIEKPTTEIYGGYAAINMHGFPLTGITQEEPALLSTPFSDRALYIEKNIVSGWKASIDLAFAEQSTYSLVSSSDTSGIEASKQHEAEEFVGTTIDSENLGRDFSEKMKRIAGCVGQYRNKYDPELYADLVTAVAGWYNLPCRRRKILDQINDILKAYTESGALRSGPEEATERPGEELNKISARIVQRCMLKLGVACNPYTVNLANPDSVEYPFVYWSRNGFAQIAWARRGKRYLVSSTESSSSKNNETCSSLIEDKIDDEDRRSQLILEIIRSKSEAGENLRTKVLDWFLPALLRYKREMALVLVASFFAQIFTVISPLIIQRIVDTVIGQGNISALNVLGFFLFSFAVLEGLLSILRTYVFSRTINNIDLALGMRVITKLLRLPFAYFSKRSVGETASRLNELENIRSFLTGSALSALLDSLFIVIYLSLMFSYSVKLTVGTLALAPLIAIITFSLAPTVRGLIREEAIENAKVQSHFIESLGSIETVKTQRLEQAVSRKWRELYSGEVRIGFKKSVIAVTGSNISEFIEQMCSLFAIWLGAYLVLGGEMTIGELFAFRILSGYVTGPIVRLTSIWQNIQEAMLSFSRLEDIICREDEAAEDHLLPSVPEDIKSISLFDVSFKYQEESESETLSHISISFQPHKFTSIVGRSGSGKSTLLKLMVRLHGPISGAVLIDGKDIRRYSIGSLRERIGFVPQDSLLLQGSVEENLSYTNPDATQKDIQWALDTAMCGFVADLPFGINTDVGERGMLLSGGQRQRLSIARAILDRPPVLLLDEATSALDLMTEREVLARINRELPDTTIISVSHRISSVKLYSDHIIVVDKGVIVEEGTHDELRDMNSFYNALIAAGEQED